jgi:hypothetical protein
LRRARAGAGAGAGAGAAAFGTPAFRADATRRLGSASAGSGPPKPPRELTFPPRADDGPATAAPSRAEALFRADPAPSGAGAGIGSAGS